MLYMKNMIESKDKQITHSRNSRNIPIASKIN
jgi:hypothetical protein